MNILEKIEKNCLIGRGGAGFPVHLKWQAVANTKSKIKYLVINGAEGEPGIYKDEYIIKNFLPEFCAGVKIASDFIKANKIYFYLNSKYCVKYKKNIIKEFNNVGLTDKIIIFEKPHDAGYIGGEESTVLNIIEGLHIEPRIRPPFPTEHGLFGVPTLVNNIETLYNVFLVSQDKFIGDRFYSINLASKNKGVYALSSDLSIKQILEKTGNYPDYDFFVQVGGDASGEVLNQGQLKQKVSGAGSITIYNLKEHRPVDLLNYWLKFFASNSCGQCTPCREGTFRLLEMFEREKISFRNNKDFQNLMASLETSSFCALGTCVPIAIKSYFKNVYTKIC